jgi:hypothetical protein
MNGPTLPPQAYTREILTAAFNWLQTQPESVRKLATTPDALVGLYLRAQRFGSSSLEADAPVSSQNFISDLKNLAEGLKQFEGPAQEQRRSMPQAPSANNAGLGARALPNQAVPPRPASQTSVAAPQASPSIQQAYAAQAAPVAAPTPQTYQAPMPQPASAPAPGFASQPPVQPVDSGAQTQAGAASNSVSQVYVQFQVPQATGSSAPLGLNESSLNMIREVKSAMNLSSDVEAINMMVAIAYKNLKDLLA